MNRLRHWRLGHAKGSEQMSKVLVISTSMRPNSNSDELAREFARGASEAGHDVRYISLRDKRFEFCRGCFACQRGGSCPLDDDATAILRAMHDADAIAFATPIYYYGMAGQMKALLDRANMLTDTDYAFGDIYLLTAAAEADDEVDARAVSGLDGWVVCFKRARLAGRVFAGGVTDPGDIAGHAALNAAFKLGRNLK